MADSPRTQVVVVGAGPAGLTLANLLRGRGIACVLLEEQSRTADPFQTRLTEARLRRLLKSKTAAAAFADIYTGKYADF